MKKLIIIIVCGILLPSISIAGNGEPKGAKNVFEWLNKNLNYPSEAIENHEEGIVYVSFTITNNGNAENIKVVDGISITLNNEAINAVKKMPLEEMYSKENPEKVYILPIKFVLK